MKKVITILYVEAVLRKISSTFLATASTSYELFQTTFLFTYLLIGTIDMGNYCDLATAAVSVTFGLKRLSS